MQPSQLRNLLRSASTIEPVSHQVRSMDGTRGDVTTGGDSLKWRSRRPSGPFLNGEVRAGENGIVATAWYDDGPVHEGHIKTGFFGDSAIRFDKAGRKALSVGERLALRRMLSVATEQLDKRVDQEMRAGTTDATPAQDPASHDGRPDLPSVEQAGGVARKIDAGPSHDGPGRL